MHSEKFTFNADKTTAYYVSFNSGCYSELEECVEEHLPFMNARSELKLAIAVGMSEYEIYFARSQRKNSDIL
jgi:hypothetical protein